MKRKFLSFLIVSIILVTGCSKSEESKPIDEKNEPEQAVQEPEVKTEVEVIDVTSKSRQVAVMINNHPTARINHSGLADAHIIYELIVEGGITRYLAIFQDKDTQKVGSIRSSRPYYIDYALENDAVYAHIGGSPAAYEDLESMPVANIDGMFNTFYFRDYSLGVPSEHTAFAKISEIEKFASTKGYRSETNKDNLFNYSIEEIDLSSIEEVKEANQVTIPYSDSAVTKYTYDPEKMLYKRYVNDAEHTDGVTKNQYTAKNIITYKVNNTVIDSHGRQVIDNLGTGTGYYISNGYAAPITWTKETRSNQTVYKYKDGTEIEINDGNTYIQIQPIKEDLTIN